MLDENFQKYRGFFLSEYAGKSTERMDDTTPTKSLLDRLFFRIFFKEKKKKKERKISIFDSVPVLNDNQLSRVDRDKYRYIGWV